jgi:hypothetical protein
MCLIQHASQMHTLESGFSENRHVTAPTGYASPADHVDPQP